MYIEAARARPVGKLTELGALGAHHCGIEPLADLDVVDMPRGEDAPHQGRIDAEELLIGLDYVLVLDLDDDERTKPGVNKEPIGLDPIAPQRRIPVTDPRLGQECIVAS